MSTNKFFLDDSNSLIDLRGEDNERIIAFDNLKDDNTMYITVLEICVDKDDEVTLYENNLIDFLHDVENRLDNDWTDFNDSYECLSKSTRSEKEKITSKFIDILKDFTITDFKSLFKKIGINEKYYTELKITNNGILNEYNNPVSHSYIADKIINDHNLTIERFEVISQFQPCKNIELSYENLSSSPYNFKTSIENRIFSLVDENLNRLLAYKNPNTDSLLNLKVATSDLVTNVYNYNLIDFMHDIDRSIEMDDFIIESGNLSYLQEQVEIIKQEQIEKVGVLLSSLNPTELKDFFKEIQASHYYKITEEGITDPKDILLTNELVATNIVTNYNLNAERFFIIDSYAHKELGDIDLIIETELE